MVTDNATCYRHPHNGAATACHRCDRPICVECMKSASVGFHCPECVKSSGQKVIRPSDLQRTPQFTMALIAINVVAFVAQTVTNDQVTVDGWLLGRSIQEGEYWRLLTSGFLHGGLIHIAFNMYLLNMLGRELERNLGAVRTGLIYFGALFGGSAAVVWFNWSSNTLGASGAVMGLGGAFAAVLYGLGQNPTQSPVFRLVLLNLALPLLVGGISFWGHFGGAAAGAIMATIVFTLPRRNVMSQQAANVLAVAAVVGFIAIGVVGGSYGINIL